MAKQKFYVVWEGVTPGIYTSWTDCQLQIKGYEAAKYKSFDTREEAERALTMSPYAYIGKNAKSKSGGSKPSSVNDLSDDNAMLEFAVIGLECDILKLSFLGRIKG